MNYLKKYTYLDIKDLKLKKCKCCGTSPKLIKNPIHVYGDIGFKHFILAIICSNNNCNNHIECDISDMDITNNYVIKKLCEKWNNIN